MIAPEELELLVQGAISQAGRAVEAVGGTRLSRTETQALGQVIATAMQMVADRCRQAAAKLPPPPPRERRHGQLFQPQPTGLIRPVTDEDIAKAKK